MAAGVTEDWLAGLETPEGIRGRSAAVDAAEDAPNGVGEHEEHGIAGSVPLDSGGGQVPAEDASEQATTKVHNLKGARAGVPNYVPCEAVAAVWAYIAMSEYKAIQPMAEQLQRIALEYQRKTRQLFTLGKWRCPRTPEQSAALRTPGPQGILNKAKKVLETITSTITPLWHAVKGENRSGWGVDDYIRETKLR